MFMDFNILRTFKNVLRLFLRDLKRTAPFEVSSNIGTEQEDTRFPKYVSP